MPINVDHYEELAGEVLKVYEQAEQTMMRRVANRLNKGVTQPGWTEKKYGEMKDVSRQMSSYVDSLSKHRGEMQKQFINQAYTDARKAAISDAQTFTQLSEIQGLTPNTVKVVNIMAELDRSMDAADRMILRKAMLHHGFKPYDCEWWHFTLKNEPYPDTYFNFPVETIK